MLKNTNLTYGSVAKWLHWLVALCILVAYATVYYSQWFTEPRSPEERFVRGFHTMFGFSALLLGAPRLVWRWINVEPRPVPAPRWQHVSANAAHWLLYFFIFAMPLSGWLGYGGQFINLFGVLEVPTFRTTELFRWLVEGKLGLTFEEWEAPIDFFHKDVVGRWLAWILIMTHIAAALYHHQVQNDNTLRRMLPGAKWTDHRIRGKPHEESWKS